MRSKAPQRLPVSSYIVRPPVWPLDKAALYEWPARLGVNPNSDLDIRTNGRKS